MAYLIEYYRDTVKIGATPWDASLEKTMQVARDGLIRHNADVFRIIDDDTGAEVESGRRDA